MFRYVCVMPSKNITKITFNASPADMLLVNAIKRSQLATHGKITNAQVLRIALRVAAK